MTGDESRDEAPIHNVFTLLFRVGTHADFGRQLTFKAVSLSGAGA